VSSSSLFLLKGKTAMLMIILVRHGLTEWNRVERFRGRAEIPLNKIGLEQARKTSRLVKGKWKPTAIYSSPLSRAMQTAQRIAKGNRLLVQPLDGLIDIDYGKWQGLSAEEVRKDWPEMISNWYEHPEIVQIPGGETLAQVRHRAVTTLNELCRLHFNEEIVLISHTVVNRLILLDILGLGNNRFWDIEQEPCAINVIEKRNEKYILHSVNNTFHL
jgi:probable phosphoglycerate mutase